MKTKKIDAETLSEIERQVREGEEYHDINLVGCGNFSFIFEIVFKVTLNGADRFFRIEAEGDFDGGGDELDWENIKDEIEEVVKNEVLVEKWQVLD